MSVSAVETPQNVYDRFTDSQPILSMLDLLEKTGRKNFNDQGAWEICLCALILKLEPDCKVQRILESLPYDQSAMDEADFLNTMAHLGYFCRPAECGLDDIDERLLPAVFIPENGVPSIVLNRNEDNDLQFYDPVSKLISTVPPAFDRKGQIWFFQKYDAYKSVFSKFMRKGTGHSWFRALLGRFKGTIAQVMITGFFLNIIALATPFFIMIVYDRVISANSISTLGMLALGALIAVIFEWQLKKIRSTGLSWLAGRLDNVVGNRIFAHLIGLSPNLIEHASVSAQVARIKTFESVRDFFGGSAFLSILEAPFVFISLIAMAFIAKGLVFIPVAMIVCYALLFYCVRQKVKVLIRLAAKESSARQQFTIETFEKLEGIRVHGLGHKWHEKFRNLSGREMMAHFQLAWVGMISETFAHTLTIIAAVATIGFGVHLIWAGSMTAGALVACMILIWRVLTPFYSLCTMVPRFEQLRNSVIQVNDLMDIETEAELAQSFSRLPNLKGHISFQNVSIKYKEDSDPVFYDLSFEANAGDMVAITGRNGSGKATVLKLIKSLHPATEGMVSIDGFDIRQLDAPYLRQQIAYVPKTPHFFEDSIINNLRFSNPLASYQEIQQALELADVWDEVQSLPDKLDTVVGMGNGTKMTSSLATRLSLARAYLHPAAILLIDELPNALLSAKTGRNLKKYLSNVQGKRTVIMCTYREDFMKQANKIIYLKRMSQPLVGEQKEMFAMLNKEGVPA